ncbi:MAG: hypothetical protein A3I01_13240 [Betaproteobacteria bacterium RIFCSPLOWO2_02_FULL_65_24]|nr:MAG: hypothetical protein A3I01_13240 [Betaproteobacteria bacterium RIFCSPLOWO2_02_FULL_65_24]OGA32621.1 MAG: hypothetical protein A3G80_11780 [Betaproteobacteria bacterium RIFCSPLOWO2_12_FULL_62_13b]
MSAIAQVQQRTVEVTARDLPLHCPTPSTPVWNMHPRVFLDVAKAGELLCPYCGTRYVYVGAPPSGAH